MLVVKNPFRDVDFGITIGFRDLLQSFLQVHMILYLIEELRDDVYLLVRLQLVDGHPLQ